jgi:hypothetical protein
MPVCDAACARREIALRSVPIRTASTISYFVTWSVRRNRTFGGSPGAGMHTVRSRRGTLAPRDFRISTSACSDGVAARHGRAVHYELRSKLTVVGAGSSRLEGAVTLAAGNRKRGFDDDNSTHSAGDGSLRGRVCREGIPKPTGTLMAPWNSIHRAVGRAGLCRPAEHAASGSGNRAQRVFRGDSRPCAPRRTDQH